MTMATPMTADPIGLRRRRELANFLRVRRESIAADHSQSRRRVPGLRREEVAERAGISVSWYTWLEQGRPIRISSATVANLAAALRLSAEERDQLYKLAALPPPLSQPVDEVCPPSVRPLLAKFDPFPAIAFCARWDIVAWNQAAVGLVGDLAQIPSAKRNMIWLLLTEPSFRERWVEPDRMIRCALGHFRAEFAERLHDPQWTGLVAALERVSPEFRKIWSEYLVMRPPDWRKHMNHPQVGSVVFDPITVSLPPEHQIRIMFLHPADHETSQKLERLAAQPVTARHLPLPVTP